MWAWFKGLFKTKKYLMTIAEHNKDGIFVHNIIVPSLTMYELYHGLMGSITFDLESRIDVDSFLIKLTSLVSISLTEGYTFDDGNKTIALKEI